MLNALSAKMGSTQGMRLRRRPPRRAERRRSQVAGGLGAFEDGGEDEVEVEDEDEDEDEDEGEDEVEDADAGEDGSRERVPWAS